MLPGTAVKTGPIQVLVIEDDVLIRMLITDELRECGFTVIEASNADEAWAFLKAGGRADVVFSDVLMPGSMNGLDLAREIKKQFRTLPIILTSGYVGENVKGRDLGSFIRKPYSINRAIMLIYEALGLSREVGGL